MSSQKATGPKEIQESILRGLNYSNIFSYPLSLHQLCLYMDRSAKFKELQTQLRKLKNKGLITQQEQLIKIRRTKCVGWSQKQAQTKKAIEKYSKLLLKLRKIPWIKFIGITGSLAAGNPGKDDDVDILIITAQDRLWLTRFFIVSYLKLWGIYRTDKEPGGKICPNILVPENNLTWPKEKQNYFVASEIVRMQPILNRNQMYIKFLTANKWIQSYFPNFHLEYIPHKEKKERTLLNPIETIFWKAQSRYMRKRKTTETTTKEFIHFNRADKTDEILSKYAKFDE